MKIALVGAGLAGKQHIHTILNNKKCKLDLIIDPSQEAYELSKKLNTQYFSNIEKALEKCRPDGVIIATPNSVHKKNAELFIKKKIPSFKTTFLLFFITQKKSYLFSKVRIAILTKS